MTNKDPDKYDIVKAKIQKKTIPGRMNSFNKKIDFKVFDGFGIVTGTSRNFAGVYLSNGTKNLYKKTEIVVIISYKKE